MEVHELGDIVDDLGGVLQRGKPIARHALPHNLVVMERGATTFERTRLRFPDVVHQGRESEDQLRARLRHHRDRVGEHVLVVMDRVLFELHRVELRQEEIRQARRREKPQARRWVRHHQQLRQLVADPLGAHDLEPIAELFHRRDEFRIGSEARTGQ